MDGTTSRNPALDLLELLAQAHAQDLPKLKAEAREVLDEIRRLSVHSSTAAADPGVSRSTYDEWLVELFRATESAVPREAMLRDFAQRFAKVHLLDRPGLRPRILVLHYLAAQGGAPALIDGFHQQGLSTDQWRRFCNHLARHQDDPALTLLFEKRERLEKEYLPYAQQAGRTGGVFDAALGRAKEIGASDWSLYGPNAWISAVPLFGDDLREGHAVVLLYPSDGRYFEYREPARSTQDLRVLDVLSAVYQQLDQQIKNLAVQVMRARDQLLARLGPAVIHHEVLGLTRQVSAVLEDLLEDWADFERLYEPPAQIERLGRRLTSAKADLDQVLTTVDAFMNLERRGQVSNFPIGPLLLQLRRMVLVRCGKIGARLDVEEVLKAPDSERTPQQLRNDATLIAHALLNLINNALDAMEERYEHWQRDCEAAAARHEPLPPPHRSVVSIRWTERALPPGCVGWEVANTGPAIPAQVAPRIFERGFTTRSQGHGQGLHLVRMTAQYCGGQVELLPADAPELRDGEAVGFLYWVTRHHHVQRELSL